MTNLMAGIQKSESFACSCCRLLQAVAGCMCDPSPLSILDAHHHASGAKISQAQDVPDKS